MTTAATLGPPRPRFGLNLGQGFATGRRTVNYVLVGLLAAVTLARGLCLSARTRQPDSTGR